MEISQKPGQALSGANNAATNRGQCCYKVFHAAFMIETVDCVNVGFGDDFGPTFR